MDPGQGKKIVVLGVMSRLPVAGIVWQTVHYLLGFQRLGYDVYYVEAHACTPKMLMQSEDDDGSARAAAFIAGTMRRFGLGGRWAFHALHADGRYYGMSEGQLKRLYGSAALIVNLHGATQPLPEHAATGRLVYLETDPGALQVELHHNVRYTLDFLEPHCAFFTFGENYGKPDCGLPVSDRFHFRPTRQPVVIDLWRPHGNGEGRAFTTVGSWRQSREITFRGEVYGWSKHQEFMKFLDLPALTNLEFELALAGCGEADWHTLETNGWSVREALALSANADAYRRYIAESRGEFTVAKDQNVRLHSGWFSDRSATYLAAGRPVVTQETGFSNVLPTGEGLFAFSNTEEAVAALEGIDADYERHRRTAAALAEEYFGHDVVLGRLLEDLGLSSPASSSLPASRAGSANDSTGAERASTLREGADRTGQGDVQLSDPRPGSSIIIPVYNNAALTRRCLDALLSGAARSSFEVVVVDNASTDATRQLLAGYGGHIRTITHETNRGFAAACNAGAALASGEYLVFLNNDVVPEAGWLDALVSYAEGHPRAAAVGSKLLFPDGTVQHAGVVICQDLGPRHLYAGFPADNPAVNKSRRFQIVTAASVLFRREPFEEAGGFDAAFRNGFEDVDLCLRLCEHGYEVHYCHESVACHLEAVSEGRMQYEEGNFRLYLERWSERLHPDDLRYYAEDGLLNLSYARSYPARLALSPLLAVVDRDGYERQSDRLLNIRSRQVLELLKETIRLSVRVKEAELRAAAAERGDIDRRIERNAREREAARSEYLDPRQVDRHDADGSDDPQSGAGPRPSREEELRALLLEAHGQLLRRDEEIEAVIYDLQSELAAALQWDPRDGNGIVGVTGRRFAPSKYLAYQRLVRQIREVVRRVLPAGATVIVVSKGDEALLELGDGRGGWHFPQDDDGVYAGHYPSGSAEALAHLEYLRERGGEFLLFPSSALWWLEHYGEFREHLEKQYRLIAHDNKTCLIFDLRELGTEPNGTLRLPSRIRSATQRDGGT